MEERRKEYIDLNTRLVDVNTRLAVLEARTARHRADTAQILMEVKTITAFINEMRPRVDCIEQATPEHRLTQLESNQKIFGIILSVLFSIAAFKDYILSAISWIIN